MAEHSAQQKKAAAAALDAGLPRQECARCDVALPSLVAPYVTFRSWREVFLSAGVAPKRGKVFPPRYLPDKRLLFCLRYGSQPVRAKTREGLGAAALNGAAA